MQKYIPMISLWERPVLAELLYILLLILYLQNIVYGECDFDFH